MNGRLRYTQAFVASHKQWVRLVYLTIITNFQGLLNISKCGLNSPPHPTYTHTYLPPPPPLFSASHVVLWNDRLHVLTHCKSDTHTKVYHCWRLHCLTFTRLFANVKTLKEAMQIQAISVITSKFSHFVSHSHRTLNICHLNVWPLQPCRQISQWYSLMWANVAQW